jgi:hypothetical protein
MDEAEVREKVLERLREGKLPQQPPSRLWGGAGVGAPCSVCDRPVAQAEMEFEVQFARDGSAPYFDVFHVHPRCYAVWELLRDGQPGAGSS